MHSQHPPAARMATKDPSSLFYPASVVVSASLVSRWVYEAASSTPPPPPIVCIEVWYKAAMPYTPPWLSDLLFQSAPGIGVSIRRSCAFCGSSVSCSIFICVSNI
ncbi:hypothetical protein E2C01_059237 [Portunus trituberculatus]|uniref:Uncharacterized protein n=1 Tax=Portunus trituberculatus TaxID=210409 RepID=A0A5B7H5I9_PORTR|nr:hypothetical protein [Portunus trituberculatus]